jgi:hypothetical protein
MTIPSTARCPTPTAAQPGEVRPRVRADPCAAEGAGRAARRVPGRAAQPAGERARPGETAERLARLAGAGVSELRLTGSQHQARHYRATLADGRVVFVKTAAGGPAGALGAEARGLGWLGGPGRSRCPAWSAWDESMLVISWVPAADAAMRRRPRGSGATWPRCTRPVLTSSGRRGRGSSPACRCRTTGPRSARRRLALAGVVREPGGCCRICAGPPTRARSGRSTCGRWRPSWPASLSWPDRPSRRAASTGTAGRGTCCGPAAGAG